LIEVNTFPCFVFLSIQHIAHPPSFLEYNIKLKHPTDLPVIDIGSGKRTVYVPAELCEIEPGQVYRGKLSDVETAQMIKIACNPPRFNAEAIRDQGFPALGLGPAKPPIDGFGLEVETDMAVIPGRELAPPALSYSKGTARVANGSWNIMDVKFHRGAVVGSWWVLVVRDGREMLAGKDDPQLKNLVLKFREKLQRSGMQVPNDLPRLLVTPPLQNIQDASREAALTEIRKVVSGALTAAGRKPSFILVLLSHRDNYIYPGIKVCFPLFYIIGRTTFLMDMFSAWATWIWGCIPSTCN
jgi:eukaryotic translation initiation factor 2C